MSLHCVTNRPTVVGRTADVKLVTENDTENDTECEVDDVEFDESKQWVITEGVLAKCGS
jgi:hypothetical protein